MTNKHFKNLKTWISENLDNIVAKYVRQWQDLPISVTIGSIIPSQKNFGNVFQSSSINFNNVK